MLRGFREGTEGIHALAVINEFSVNLIRNDEQIVRDRDIDDQLHFVVCQHLAGRIARVDNADGFGFRRNHSFDLFFYRVLVAFLRSRRDSNQFAARSRDESLVVGIERFCHDDFIVIVQQRGHQHGNRFRTSGGNQQILLFKIKTQSLVVTNQSFQ